MERMRWESRGVKSARVESDDTDTSLSDGILFIEVSCTESTGIFPAARVMNDGGIPEMDSRWSFSSSGRDMNAYNADCRPVVMVLQFTPKP